MEERAESRSLQFLTPVALERPPPRPQDLVDWALEQHDLRGTIDNVTVVVAMFV